MKPGLKFENSGMKLVCIAFYSLGKRNVGLFQRESDGMYITARNTSKESDGSYLVGLGALLPYPRRCRERLSEAIRGNVPIHRLTEWTVRGAVKAPLFLC